MEITSWTGLKSPFGITEKKYSSGLGECTTIVNRTIRFSAMVNSCVSGRDTTVPFARESLSQIFG